MGRHKDVKIFMMQKFVFIDTAMRYPKTLMWSRYPCAHEGAAIKLLPYSCLTQWLMDFLG